LLAGRSSFTVASCPGLELMFIVAPRADSTEQIHPKPTKRLDFMIREYFLFIMLLRSQCVTSARSRSEEGKKKPTEKKRSLPSSGPLNTLCEKSGSLSSLTSLLRRVSGLDRRKDR
jgi:hypothetical protein